MRFPCRTKCLLYLLKGPLSTLKAPDAMFATCVRVCASSARWQGVVVLALTLTLPCWTSSSLCCAGPVVDEELHTIGGEEGEETGRSLRSEGPTVGVANPLHCGARWSPVPLD